MENLLNMQNKYNQQIKDFVNTCHKIADYNLVQCSSGNLSYRLDENLAVLSASGSWLADITEDQVAICSLNDGKCINEKTPTAESTFHLQILKQRQDVNVVLHFQSPFATAITCGNPDDYNFNLIPEIPYYIDPPAVVDYLPPGSQQLADTVTDALKDKDLAILRNHGLVTVGKDFNDVIQKACFFELACRILLLQDNPAFLTQKDVDNLSKGLVKYKT